MTASRNEPWSSTSGKDDNLGTLATVVDQVGQSLKKGAHRRKLPPLASVREITAILNIGDFITITWCRCVRLAGETGP